MLNTKGTILILVLASLTLTAQNPFTAFFQAINQNKTLSDIFPEPGQTGYVQEWVSRQGRHGRVAEEAA
jgi:hypothetical protein